MANGKVLHCKASSAYLITIHDFKRINTFLMLVLFLFFFPPCCLFFPIIATSSIIITVVMSFVVIVELVADVLLISNVSNLDSYSI